MTKASSQRTGDYRGRFAPSPTGALHFGSLLAAAGSWLRARSEGGQWLLRIEDLDPPREVAGAADSFALDLAGFGLDWDGPVLRQSERSDAYQAALDRLVAAGHAFPCRCSRSQIARRGGHHGRCQAPIGSAPVAWRLLAADVEIAFEDAIQGWHRQQLGREVGDFVVRRVDGLWAYQLAVVVDDAAQGITEVLRGADLIESTPRQIALQRALGLATPAYAHLPVLLGEDGAKLSKQTRALPVDRRDPMPALRHALLLLGIPAPVLAGARAPAAALAAAIPAFALTRIPRQASLRSAAWRAMATG